jgi:hypothetical protein
MQQRIVIRVRLEPRLEAIAGQLPASERRNLAKVFYRWSKQLWVSAKVLEPQPPKEPQPHSAQQDPPPKPPGARSSAKPGP